MRRRWRLVSVKLNMLWCRVLLHWKVNGMLYVLRSFMLYRCLSSGCSHTEVVLLHWNKNWNCPFKMPPVLCPELLTHKYLGFCFPLVVTPDVSRVLHLLSMHHITEVFYMSSEASSHISHRMHQLCFMLLVFLELSCLELGNNDPSNTEVRHKGGPQNHRSASLLCTLNTL